MAYNLKLSEAKKYSGQVYNGKPEGFGLIQEGNQEYFGLFKEGSFYLFASLSKEVEPGKWETYWGTVVNGEFKHGLGILTKPDGSRYEGTFGMN